MLFQPFGLSYQPEKNRIEKHRIGVFRNG